LPFSFSVCFKILSVLNTAKLKQKPQRMVFSAAQTFLLYSSLNHDQAELSYRISQYDSQWCSGTTN